MGVQRGLQAGDDGEAAVADVGRALWFELGRATLLFLEPDAQVVLFVERADQRFDPRRVVVVVTDEEIELAQRQLVGEVGRQQRVVGATLVELQNQSASFSVRAAGPWSSQRVGEATRALRPCTTACSCLRQAFQSTVERPFRQAEVPGQRLAVAAEAPYLFHERNRLAFAGSGLRRLVLLRHALKGERFRRQFQWQVRQTDLIAIAKQAGTFENVA